MAKENRTYPWSKLYSDTFDSTSWRIIFGLGQPMAAYCVQMYMVIRVESAKSGGALLRDGDSAYTRAQLMSICGFMGDKKAKLAGARAYHKLIEEGLIFEDQSGVIHVSEPNFAFGKDTDGSRRIKAWRDEKRYSGVTNETKNGDSVLQTKRKSDEKRYSGVTNETANPPFYEDTLSYFPPNNEKKKLKKEKGRHVPSNILEKANAFLKEYPKKGTKEDVIDAFLALGLEEREFIALMAAVDRLREDSGKTANDGRYCKPPSDFVRSKPWTEEELRDAELILEGRRRDELIEREEGGRADATRSD